MISPPTIGTWPKMPQSPQQPHGPQPPLQPKIPQKHSTVIRVSHHCHSYFSMFMIVTGTKWRKDSTEQRSVTPTKNMKIQLVRDVVVQPWGATSSGEAYDSVSICNNFVAEKTYDKVCPLEWVHKSSMHFGQRQCSQQLL